MFKFIFFFVLEILGVFFSLHKNGITSDFRLDINLVLCDLCINRKPNFAKNVDRLLRTCCIHVTRKKERKKENQCTRCRIFSVNPRQV